VVPTQISTDDGEALAARILEASAAKNPIAPITEANPEFDLASAYAVSAKIAKTRSARGERPIGWKIGFTNESTWKDFGVHAPIWGPMYESTVAEVDPAGAVCSIGALLEPRIEPEIALRIAKIPNAEMDEEALLSCIDAVAHGFEIVQSVYPGWSGKAPDCIAAFGMHGFYRHGPFVPVAPGERARWLEMLRDFTVVLFRDGAEMERGVGKNVLGGPLSALRHFVRGMAAYPGYALKAGDIVTTGTLTRALSVAPGERWSTRLEDIPLSGMDLKLTA
jgi:2-keto-4-pentenoate hydratase